MEEPVVVRVRQVGSPTVYTYVFVGTVSEGLKKALEKNKESELKAFYGPKWKSKLGKTGGSINDVSSDDSYDEYFREGTCARKGGNMAGKVGGDFQLDLDDIEELLSAKTEPAVKIKRQSGAIDVVHDSKYVYIDILPDDNLFELKEKIYIGTGIPVYRQHIVSSRSTYNIVLDGVYDNSIEGIASPANNTIAGIRVDQYMYQNRDNIKIEALDAFTLTRDWISGPIDLYDMADHTDRRVLYGMINDNLSLSMVYYGAILKYWPMLSLNAFMEYIIDEHDLHEKYPELLKSKASLIEKYKTESTIVKGLGKKADLTMAITGLLGNVKIQCKVSERNLFEYFNVSDQVPEIQTRIEKSGSLYLLQKQHKKLQISFPTFASMRRGVVFAINTDAGFVFLAISDIISIRAAWDETDMYDFDDIMSVLKKSVNPVIDEINKMPRTAFTIVGKIPRISTANISYEALQVNLYWKRVVSSNGFKDLKRHWDLYFKAGIAMPKIAESTSGGAVSVRGGTIIGGASSIDTFDLVFHKGVYDFDKNVEKIMQAASIGDVNNQYAYLTNSTVNQKWTQLHSGRDIHMQHRITDIKFEISNIRESEFDNVRRYIEHFVATAKLSTGTAVSSRSLYKLREQDPELFDLKRHGSKRVYSVLCQKHHQPVIYDESELAGLSKSKLVKYWNFTREKPAWYSCPNPDYPHLGFIVNSHPKNYCLPCCHKKLKDPDSAVQSECMNTHMHVAEATAGKHIMNYGKELEVGRQSKTPLKNLFYDITEYDMRLYGVPQSIGGYNCGYIYAICEALGLTAPAYIDAICKYIMQNSLFTVANGYLAEYFQSVDQLAFTIRDIFLKGNGLTHELQWTDVFIDLTYEVYGISVAVFIDNSRDDIMLHVRSVGDTVILFKMRDVFYPMFAYGNDEVVRTFKADSKIALLIKSMADYYRKNNAGGGLHPTVSVLASIGKITMRYVNKHNLTYGVLCDGAYFPVEYELVGDDTPTSHLPPAGPIKLSALVDLVSRYNAQAESSYSRIVLSSILYYGDRMIGLRAADLLFYFTEADITTDLPAEYLNYDFHDVNKAILQCCSIADDGRKDIAMSLYRTYQYRLLLLHFVSYIENERNMKLREKLTSLIKSGLGDLSQFRAKLRELVGQDYQAVSDDIAQNFADGVPAILAAIDSTRYGFDRMTVSRLKSLPQHELRDELRKIVLEFAVEGEVTVSSFPNILQTCGKFDYCKDSRLVVQKLDEKIELLQSEITNDLKRAMLENVWLDTVLDYFNFTSRDITIYRIK